MIAKRITGGALALLASGALVLGAAGTASAAPVKDCGTTTSSEPVNGGLTKNTSTTTTQTSSCNSNSDTGQQTTTTSTVNNRSGHAPPGAQ